MSIYRKILRNWKTEYLNESAPGYPIYHVDDMNIILSVSNDVLKKYKEVKRRGTVGEMDDSYEMNILDKAIEKYKIQIHPNLYYVMWSN